MKKLILFLFLTSICFGSGNLEVSEGRIKILSPDGSEAMQLYRSNTQNFLNWTTTSGDTTLFLIGGPVDLNLKGMTNVGNLTQVGNITGDDIDISAGTGDYTTSGTGTFGSISVDSIDANSVTVNDLTPTRVVFVGAAKELTDNAVFTFITDTLLSPNVTASGTVQSSVMQLNLSATGVYKFEVNEDAERLAITNTVEGENMSLRLYSALGAGDDIVGIQIHGVGKADDRDPRSVLGIAWDGGGAGAGEGKYIIQSAALNSPVHPICIITGANTDQLLLNIDGTTELKTGTGTANFIIPDGGHIGSASKTDAIKIDSTGSLTFVENVHILDILTVDENVILNSSSGTTILNRLTASSGVYLGASKELTNTAPDGIVGHWSRAGTDITTANAADTLTLNGNLTIDLLAANADAVITMDGSGDTPGTIVYTSTGTPVFTFDKDVAVNGYVSSAEIGNQHDATIHTTTLWGHDDGGGFENIVMIWNPGSLTFSSSTGIGQIEWNMNMKLGDNKRIVSGISNDFTQEWRNQGASNDYYRISTRVNSANGSGAIVIVPLNYSNEFGEPDAVYPNPQLHLHSGVANEQTSRMRLWTDNSHDGNIATDQGDLNLIPAGGGVIVTGTVATTGGDSTEWNTAYDNMVTDIAFNTGDGIITVTQQDSGTLLTDSLDGRYYTETELGSTSNGVGASLIGIEDDMSLYAGTDVEDALEEVMDQITIETHVADSFEVGGDQVGTVTGIVENTQVINDGDELILNETTGGPNPNFVQTFEFSGITAGHESNLIELHWYYSPTTSPHTISIQMYNYNTSTWDVIDNTTLGATGGTLTFSTFTIIDGGSAIVDYTSGGASRVKFSHDDNGIASHDFGIDYLAIKDDHGIGSGITDHGSMSGLQDDDHDPLYHTDGRAATWLAANHETTYTHADIATNTTHSGTTHDYNYISGNDGATDVTAAELEELSDGSDTTLHSHFVDRGDPADWDYGVGDFTADSAWHDLDLGTDVGVPVGAKAVLIHIEMQDDNDVNNTFRLRKNGNTNAITRVSVRTQVVDLVIDADVVVACDTDRVIEYRISTGIAFTILNVIVKGWWL